MTRSTRRGGDIFIPSTAGNLFDKVKRQGIRPYYNRNLITLKMHWPVFKRLQEDKLPKKYVERP